MVSFAASPFPDVPHNSWFHDSVAWAYANNITTGFGDGTFRPTANVTRGEFITFLHRIAGRPATGNVVRFSDVANPASFYFGAVNWAALTGITTGFGDGTFRPRLPITREELSTMMFRFARTRGSDTTAAVAALQRFPDQGSVSSFAIESMRWATNRGIVRGSGGRLLPRATASRAESLTMLYRYIMDVQFNPSHANPPPQPGGGHFIRHCHINGFPSANRWVNRGEWVPDMIVLHTTAGSAQSAINTSFRNHGSNRTSYHFVVAGDGTITQIVPLTDSAWGNGTTTGTGLDSHIWSTHPVVRSRPTNANHYTVSIGFADAGPTAAHTSGHISPAQIYAGAWLIEHIRFEIWRIYGLTIPINRSTVIGHNEITPRTTGHPPGGCPGPLFQFDAIISRVRQ